MSYVFLSNRNILLLFYITVIFIRFYNVFALDSLNISSGLNSRLPGPRRRARSYIVLEYNNENMGFIRLLLANSCVPSTCANNELKTLPNGC